MIIDNEDMSAITQIHFNLMNKLKTIDHNVTSQKSPQYVLGKILKRNK